MRSLVWPFCLNMPLGPTICIFRSSPLDLQQLVVVGRFWRFLDKGSIESLLYTEQRRARANNGQLTVSYWGSGKFHAALYKQIMLNIKVTMCFCMCACVAISVVGRVPWKSTIASTTRTAHTTHVSHYSTIECFLRLKLAFLPRILHHDDGLKWYWYGMMGMWVFWTLENERVK